MIKAPEHYGRFPGEAIEDRDERIALEHMQDRLGWFSLGEFSDLADLWADGILEEPVDE